MKIDFHSTKPPNLPVTTPTVTGGWVILASVAVFTCLGVTATGTPTVSVKDRLAKLAAAEMPALAAQMVETTKPVDRPKITAEVVKAAVTINPAAACTLIATISRAVPNMAGLAAGVAATAQPKQAAGLARAAAAAVPAQAGEIVGAVCCAVPYQYKRVALAVAGVVPGASREIILGVAAAVPGLEPGISAALARSGTKIPSVPEILAAVKPPPSSIRPVHPVALTGSDDSRPGAPATQPPPVPPPRADPPTPGPGPRGRRNYAAP